MRLILTPVILMATGVYLSVFPYILRYDWGVSTVTITILSTSFIIAGIIVFTTQGIQKRLRQIERQLEIENENHINNLSLIPSDNYIKLLEPIKRIKYVYKASIYLPSINVETLVFLRSFLDSTQIDSTLRIIINEVDADKILREQYKLVMAHYKDKHKNEVELRITSNVNMFFSIIILDAKVWILTNFGKEIQNSLLFNISSYTAYGKSFVDLFNMMWTTSETSSVCDNENKDD